LKVGICVVGYRNPEDIFHCIQALEKTTYPEFEIVVCENGGDGAFKILKAGLPGALAGGQAVRLISAPSNPGYAAGINLCMDASADADAWWILNPDTVPDPQALARLCACLTGGGYDAVGSTVHDSLQVVQSRGGSWTPWLGRAVSLDGGRPVASTPTADTARRLDYLSGASMLVGRSFVDHAGRMREDYFLYGEEVEWCLRAKAQGARLGLAADANVLHLQGTTTGSVSDIHGRGRMPVYLDERNKLLTVRDRFPGLLPVAAVGTLAMLVLRFGRRGAWAQLRYAVQGWWSGLRNERGKPGWVASGSPSPV